MNIIDGILATRLVFILGSINLVTGLLVFLTCRCLPGSKIGGGLMKYRVYQRFFKYHCYIWLVFWSSVMIHAILAVFFVGWPA